MKWDTLTCRRLYPASHHHQIINDALFVVHQSLCLVCLMWHFLGTLIDRRCSLSPTYLWEWGGRKGRTPPSLITSAMRRVYRTLPFFIGPSVDRLSLKDGDEWQRSIAIADRIEREHYLIDPSMVESVANIDKIGCEIRREDVMPT